MLVRGQGGKLLNQLLLNVAGSLILRPRFLTNASPE